MNVHLIFLHLLYQTLIDISRSGSICMSYSRKFRFLACIYSHIIFYYIFCSSCRSSPVCGNFVSSKGIRLNIFIVRSFGGWTIVRILKSVLFYFWLDKSSRDVWNSCLILCVASVSEIIVIVIGDYILVHLVWIGKGIQLHLIQLSIVLSLSNLCMVGFGLGSTLNRRKNFLNLRVISWSNDLRSLINTNRPCTFLLHSFSHVKWIVCISCNLSGLMIL